MFQKELRKKLEEHNWLYLQDTEKNPSQTYKRFRKSALTAIRDLSLLARKLPTDKQQEIFNEDTIKPFLLSLFLVDESGKEAKLRLPNVGLASLLVEEGVNICLSKYRDWNKDTPESAKPTIEYLGRAIQICREIGYKSFKIDLETNVFKEKHRLICIWENRLDADFERFEKYVVEQMKLSTPDISFQKIETAKFNEFYYRIWFHYGDPSEGQSDLLGYLQINFTLNKKEGQLLDNNEGTITFYDDHGKETKKKNIKILKHGSKHVLIEA